MNQNELFSAHETLSSDIDELARRSTEIRLRSLALKARSEQLKEKVEDLHKRSLALREASRISRGNNSHVLKRCGRCGKEHAVIDWFNLPFVGYQESQQIDGELRNCTCNSTLLFITRKELKKHG